MGKIKQGLLGGVSGKVGPTVGSSWKGIPVLKALPLSVANPRTAGQVAQRTKMTNVVAFAQLILATVIKPLWDRFAQQASGYNEFVSANIGLFAASLPSPVSDLVISRGKMASTPVDSASSGAAEDPYTINWTDDSGSGLKLATDVAFAVVVNSTKGSVIGGSSAAVRSDGTMSLEKPGDWLPVDDIHVYLAFRREDGTVVSDNSYYEA